MMIYIHYIEKDKFIPELLKIYPDIISFRDISEIEGELQKKESLATQIICVEDHAIIHNLKKHAHVFIVNMVVLMETINNYKHFYSKKLLYNLLNNVVLKFTGFPRDNELMTLTLKSVIMGARISTKDKELSHLIPYRMSGVTVTQTIKRDDKIKTFSRIFIDYYWNNCLTIFKPYTDMDNQRLETKFCANLFTNCRIVLWGFESDVKYRMIAVILRLGGSVLQLNNVNRASHIICPSDCDIMTTSTEQLELIPESLLRNIITEVWYHLSLSSGYLIGLENYQLFCSSYAQVQKNSFETNVEKDDNLIGDEEKDILPPKIGYNPRLATVKKDNKCKETRIATLRTLFTEFDKGFDFYKGFNNVLSSTMNESNSLKIIFESFHPIEEFYGTIREILEPLLNSYQDDTCYGMSLSPLYGQIKAAHIKFNSENQKFLGLLKQAMKGNLILSEKLQQILATVNLDSLELLTSWPYRSLMHVRTALAMLLSNTRYTHPDLPYLEKILRDTSQVVVMFDTVTSKLNEIKKQFLITNCTGYTFANALSTFICVVDCLSFDHDNLRTPLSMFVYSDKIVLSVFGEQVLVNKRFAMISNYLKKHNVEKNEENGVNLSRCTVWSILYKNNNYAICSCSTNNLRTHNSRWYAAIRSQSNISFTKSNFQCHVDYFQFDEYFPSLEIIPVMN